MKRFLKITLFTIILFLVGIIKVSADENIAITDVNLEEKSEYVIINEEVSVDNNKITSNVVFYDEGDYVIYKLTIKNNDNQDYKIEDILDDNTSEYLSFEYSYDDGVLKAKSSKDFVSLWSSGFLPLLNKVFKYFIRRETQMVIIVNGIKI